ncbi:fertilization-influencing membrane protein [Vulpes vulpes]|uniref:Fertilization-influencing membrane protein n=1 Tax=Vulpes vulpes TaxID=9627 RepID=A0ABM5A4B9_VULVU
MTARGGGSPAPSSQHFLSPLPPELCSEWLQAMTSQSPHPCDRSGRVMRLWQWTRAWAWLVGLGAIETAPRRENANVLARGAESLLFIERPDFFDYPDSDQARILAVAQFIGEKPVIFVNSGSNSEFFHHILVGALVVAFLFLLYQFFIHM